MSYWTVAIMKSDSGLISRMTVCAAQEIAVTAPEQWVQQNLWALICQPGWADAYASAIASNISNPGVNEGVITDGMILSAVQAIRDAATQSGV